MIFLKQAGEMNKKIKPKYDAVVIGAGIGGLLAASFLVKKGYKTCVLERLSFCGGKFTGFNYKGFQIPSGAFHMIPAVEKGGFGRCFADLGLDIEYRQPKTAAAVILENGIRYPLYNSPLKNIFSKSYLRKFSLRELREFAVLAYSFYNKKVKLPDILFSDFLKIFTTSKRIMKLIDQIMIFSNGTDIYNASLVEFRNSIKTVKFDKEACIKGGCRHLINELEDYIRRGGGGIFNKTAVKKIIINKNITAGIELGNGQKIKADIVVSNAGPRRTGDMLGNNNPKWLAEKERTFKSVPGISYSVATDKPLLSHDAVEFPMDCDHIAGYIQISNLDSGLAPNSKHLLLAAQMAVDPDIKITGAIENGVKDLLNVFPQITRNNIINISSFHKGWTAAPTGQVLGQTGESRYPVRVEPFDNLYMLGYDSQGWGFAGDIIGHAALNFREMI
jgi:phytoene dehydrogenase-like protein